MLEDGGQKVRQSRRRGRGAVTNASGRFEAAQREGFDDGWSIDEDLPPVKVEVHNETPRSIISRNTSPDIPFDRSVNPYRGCEHGCIYCYARPSHVYLGHSAGLDFETQLSAKPDAARLLREAFEKPRYTPAPLALGANTDPYQPIERERGITREILEVLVEYRHPFSITTKSALVLRDLDLLTEAAAMDLVRVSLSVTSLDHRLSRLMEPRASAPQRRFAAMKTLSDAGVPVMAMCAPMIPALNDPELEKLLEASAEAGAQMAGYITLRMPLEVKDLFREWLETHFPDRAGRILRHVREMHGGQDYSPDWGKRMKGEGPYAALIARRFKVAIERLGLEKGGMMAQRCDLFRRRGDARQLHLGDF